MLIQAFILLKLYHCITIDVNSVEHVLQTDCRKSHKQSYYVSGIHSCPCRSISGVYLWLETGAEP